MIDTYPLKKLIFGYELIIYSRSATEKIRFNNIIIISYFFSIIHYKIKSRQKDILYKYDSKDMSIIRYDFIFITIYSIIIYLILFIFYLRKIINFNNILYNKINSQ